MINEKILKTITEAHSVDAPFLEYAGSASVMSGILAFNAPSMRREYHIVAPSEFDVQALNRVVMTSCGANPEKYYSIGKKPFNNSYSLIVINHAMEIAATLEEAAKLVSPGGFILLTLAEEPEDTINLLCQKYDMVASRRMMVDGVKEKFTIIKKTKNVVSSEPPKDCDVTFAMVLKTGGGTYDYRYVNALANNIKKHVSIPHQIVCLTDDSTGIDTSIVKIVSLKHNLIKWWSKIELFDSSNFNTNKVFYLDLDTVIVDNIDHIVCGIGQPFVALRDFYHMFTLQTGLLCWENGKFDHIYQRFLPRMHYFASPEIGDHVWIGENCTKTPEFFQDLHGNQVVSYKKDCKNGKLPPNAKIVCFHGNPRPHTVTDRFVSDNWMYQK